jgi:hypothetical protein
LCSRAFIGAHNGAIAWFPGVLGFTLIADKYQPEQDNAGSSSRRPAPARTPPPFLACAAAPEQEAAIGTRARPNKTEVKKIYLSDQQP